MKFISILAGCLLCILLHVYPENNYVDIKTLPLPDCNTENSPYMKFISRDTFIVVIPDSPSETEDFQKYLGEIKKTGKQVTIKKESELEEEDYKKPMFIYGITGDFANWRKFGLPFSGIPNGFRFEESIYTGPEDGFLYISPDRLAISGNSFAAILKNFQSYAAFYTTRIIEDGRFSLLFFNDSTRIDLKKIRQLNYNHITTEYYNLYIDKKIEDFTLDNSIIYDICERMNLELPDFRITAFVHANPNATRLFTNFYSMTGCDTLPDTMTFGTVVFNEIHVTGKNTGMIRHETFHAVWEKLVGPTNTFYTEGIQKYYEFLHSPKELEKSVEIQKKYIDYDITNIIETRGDNFFKAPTESGWTIAYPISGLFVKYLIDMEGLETFKQFSIQTDRKKAIPEFYKTGYEELIESYKDWIRGI